MIEVYTMPLCASCQQTKAALRAAGIAFTERPARDLMDAASGPEAGLGLVEASKGGLPVVVVGGQVLAWIGEASRD